MKDIATMDIPKMMRGVRLIGHGGMDQLDIRTDIPVPRPAKGDVLVRVAAAGVNNTDINTRTGWYSKHDGASTDAAWSGQALHLPRIQGADACGHIVAVGEGVNRKRVGERVLIEPCLQEANGKTLETPWYFGSECDGAFADYTVVAARHAHAVQSDLSDIELASFPCSYSTAENLLTRANVGGNQRVLITGASGGVGSAAVQLAKVRNAHVTAITTAAKSSMLRKLGADETIARNTDLIATCGKNSMDVVIDLVAGERWPHYLEVLRPFGRYAAAGAIAGPIVELDVRTLYLKDLSLFGCTVLEPEVFGNLMAHIENGKIKPLVARTFALEEICDAQNYFLKKQHIGKIVIAL